MCGRYYIDIDSEEYKAIIKRVLELTPYLDLEAFQKKEVFPGGNCLVLKADKDKILPEIMHWSLNIGKYKLINLRCESLKYKAKDLYHQRCVVIASGFYEWDLKKERHYFDDDKKIMYIAGVYEEGQKGRFALLTKEASEQVAKYHPREPMIIPKSLVDKYLKNEINI